MQEESARLREAGARPFDWRPVTPVNVYRDWDRGRTYSWNRHRYHWHGGAWVILDASPGYGDGYGYDYPTSYAYSSPSYAGSMAARVQSDLADQGYDPGPIDGVIGPQTTDAIAAFQSDNGLPVTGNTDDPLLRALGL